MALSMSGKSVPVLKHRANQKMRKHVTVHSDDL